MLMHFYQYIINREHCLGFSIHLWTLSGISDFLQNLQISKTGQAFIIERDGNIIASSAMREPYKMVNDTLVRLSVFSSQDSVIQKAATNLVHQGESFINTTSPEQFTFQFQEKNYFTKVTPYQDGNGLDWIIITIIPESDFMEKIYANNKITIILIIVSVIGSLILCFILSRWITRPIISINKAARSIAAGEWIPIDSTDRRG